MENKLYEALVYAYELLKEQAETGHYPVNALAENGGKGYEPITNALRACEGEYLNENSGLNTPVVSQRSELLAFCEWYKTTDFNCEGNPPEECVDEYKKANCG